MNRKWTMTIAAVIAVLGVSAMFVSPAQTATTTTIPPAKELKITGVVIFEVNGTPEYAAFVFENGQVYTMDTNDCDYKCDALMRQLSKAGRVKALNVLTKVPDTKL